MKYAAPAPAHALGPKLGEMSRERAIEINSAMVTLSMASILSKDGTPKIGKAAQLVEKLNLADLLEADRVIRSLDNERNEEGQTVSYMKVADRGIAAMYALLSHRPEQEDEAIFHLPANQFWLGRGRVFLIHAFRTDEQIAEASAGEDR